MASVLDRITTKDILAVMVVGSTLIFNAASMWFDKPLDAGTIGMAGLIVGYYFNSSATRRQDEPLPPPYTGEVERVDEPA
jgi:hypothetical protein